MAVVYFIIAVFDLSDNSLLGFWSNELSVWKKTLIMIEINYYLILF